MGNVEVHCPRCGDLMQMRETELTCVGGDMPLSRKVESALRAFVEAGPGLPELSTHRWGGTWRCPADGARMIETDGLLRCSKCKRYLQATVIYQLIELHPHAR